MEQLGFGKIAGSALAFSASTIGFVASAAMMPVLTLPIGALELYTAQKLLNNTIYKSYKDLAFIAKKHGPNMKIYQDVVRPDILSILMGLDDRQKLGFLQLQALVGMTKFDTLGKDGSPITLETDSHGIIRKTFQTLSELGYLQNYEETFLKNSRLILPKLAFGNTKIGKTTPVYNMKFQKTDRAIDFEDPAFRKMFPAVFGKRGVIAKQGYEIAKDEDGKLTINYPKRKEQKQIEDTKTQNIEIPRKASLKESVKANISQEEQAEFSKLFIEKTDSQMVGDTEKHVDIEEQK